MGFSELLKRGEILVGENSSTILTGVGVAGTVATAVLTGRATFKAAEILQRENGKIRLESDGLNNIDDLHFRDKAEIVWKEYIPPVGVGLVTITSIIMANRIDSKKAAALAAAYGLSEQAFREYRDKVVEKVGSNKATAIRDEVAQDRVTKRPPTTEVIIAGSGDVLCCDLLTMRYFVSSVEKIRKAENEINFKIAQEMYASLTQFYDLIGLEATAFSEDVGFNLEHRCEVQFSTTTTPDDRPCLTIGFATGPTQNYAKFY